MYQVLLQTLVDIFSIFHLLFMLLDDLDKSWDLELQ